MPMMYQNSLSPRQQLLNRITELSFAVDDILLYLDTHPHDQKALEFANTHIAQRKKLLEEYENSYGPLIAKNAMECQDIWKWAEQPFPWEQEGGCR